MFSTVKGFSKFFFLSFVVLLGVIGCKKDVDQSPPSLWINTPNSGETIVADSGFFILATVLDNKAVKNVTIKLYDNVSKEYVNGVRNIQINKPQFELSYFYEIRGDVFNSSNYSLELTAYDEDNSTSEAIDINIQYSGYRYRGPLVTTSSANSTTIFLLNNISGQVETIGSQSISSAGIAMAKKSQNYILLEKNAPAIKGYSLSDHSLQWSYQFNPSGGPFEFSKLVEIDELIYCLNFNNQIFMFDYQGVPRGIIGTVFQPQEVKKIGNFLYTIEKRINDQTYYLGQYGYSGSFISNVPLNMNAVSIEESSNGDVYILGNKNGKGRLMEFKLVAGALNFITSFNHSISASFTNRNNLYFNSLDNGNLYEYSINMTTGIRKTSNVFADQFYINEKENLGLYNHHQSGELYELDLSSISGRLVSTFPDKVNAFTILLQK